MLKLNISLEPIVVPVNNLNTSHVKVKPKQTYVSNLVTNLNTSHVKVKPDTILENFANTEFKYISC